MNIIMTLAQDPRIDGTLKLTEQASGLGGNVFMATLIILLALVYLFGVVIPNARSQRQNTEKLTEVIAAIGGQLNETHGHAENASQNSDKLVAAIRTQTRVVEKINDAGPRLDIKSELGEIRGALAG
jgi:hypothetical protein